MKKLKVTLLILYILVASLLIFESSLPDKASGNVSSNVGLFFSKFFNVFVKNKIVKAKEIITGNITTSYETNTSFNLEAYVTPNNSSYKSLTYSTNNPNILKVDDLGNVSILNEGSSIITIIQKESNIKKEIMVNCVNKPITDATNIKLEIDKKEINQGDIVKINVLVEPITYTDISISLSDNNLAKIIDNKIYALKPGDLNITVKTLNGLTDTINLKINPNVITKPSYMNFNDLNDNYIVNEEAKITFDTDSSLDIYNNLLYNVSDNEIVEVDDLGNIIFKKAGKAFIKAYTFDLEHEKIYEIDVNNILPDFLVDDEVIIIGKTKKININILNNPTYNKFTYEVDNNSVATIDAYGLITPRKKGETIARVIVTDEVGNNVIKEFKIEARNKTIYDVEGFNFNRFVRKVLGHFSGYFLLGAIGLFMYMLWIKKVKFIPLYYPVTLLSGLSVSIITEIIQLSTSGRNGNIIDVLIDFSGYTLSTIIASIIFYLIIKNKKKKI